MSGMLLVTKNHQVAVFIWPWLTLTLLFQISKEEHETGSQPTRAWFDKKFFAILGHDYGGHSPCVGGETFYASLGLFEDIIQAIGRWSSTAWKIYIRDNLTVRAEQQLAVLWMHLQLHSTISAPR